MTIINLLLIRRHPEPARTGAIGLLWLAKLGASDTNPLVYPNPPPPQTPCVPASGMGKLSRRGERRRSSTVADALQTFFSPHPSGTPQDGGVAGDSAGRRGMHIRKKAGEGNIRRCIKPPGKRVRSLKTSRRRRGGGGGGCLSSMRQCRAGVRIQGWREPCRAVRWVSIAVQVAQVPLGNKLLLLCTAVQKLYFVFITQ